MQVEGNTVMEKERETFKELYRKSKDIIEYLSESDKQFIETHKDKYQEEVNSIDASLSAERYRRYSTNHRELNASTVNTVANLNFMRAPRVQLSEKGEGMFRLSASLLYVGELKSGEPDGKGTVYDLATRLAVYEGSFSNGVYSGRGKRYSRGELIEEGDFANGLLTSGIRHLPNGLLQCGSFVNDELCGMGRLVFPNGFFVSGYFSGTKNAGLANQPFLAAVPSAKNAKKFVIGVAPLKGMSFFFEDGVFISDRESLGYLFYYNGDVFVGEVAGATPRNGVMFKFTGVKFMKMMVGSKEAGTTYKEPKIHVEQEFKYFEMSWSVCWLNFGERVG